MKKPRIVEVRSGSEILIRVIPDPKPKPKPKPIAIPKATTPRTGESVIDILRRCIRESGLSQAEIARQSKVVQPAINRFMHGWSLQLVNAQKLMDYFGIKVTR